MSSRSAHINQARHNEALARELVNGGYRYRDWAVIAAFYAAIHYFEARLHNQPSFTHPNAGMPIVHTDDSIPPNLRGGRPSPHVWREELLRHNCTPGTRRAYQRLRFASETARYHRLDTGEIQSTAHDHFTNREVDRYLSTHLATVKTGLGFS